MSVENREKIVNCWGDYQAGPIAVSLEERADWLCQHYYDVGLDGAGMREEYLKQNIEFSKVAANGDVLKTIWYSKVCAGDYCGYLEFLYRARENHDVINVIELTEALPDENERYSVCSGSIGPNHFVEAMKSCRPPHGEELTSGASKWSKLCNENADLRMIGAEGLVSLELSYFDDDILKLLTKDFQKAARVVGNSMGAIDGKRDVVQGYSDMFYFSRLKELHRQGRIEWQGSRDYMREAAVRLVS